MAEERYWYPLDGTWHASVATRASKLHLAKAKGVALCREYFLNDDDAYTEKAAAESFRGRCPRCLKLSGVGGKSDV